MPEKAQCGQTENQKFNDANAWEHIQLDRFNDHARDCLRVGNSLAIARGYVCDGRPSVGPKSVLLGMLIEAAANGDKMFHRLGVSLFDVLSVCDDFPEFIFDEAAVAKLYAGSPTDLLWPHTLLQFAFYVAGEAADVDDAPITAPHLLAAFLYCWGSDAPMTFEGDLLLELGITEDLVARTFGLSLAPRRPPAGSS